MSVIQTELHNNVLIVKSNNPPVNALGHAVRVGLQAAIEEAKSNDNVEAVVIIGEGQTYFAGADISEFGSPIKPPHLLDLIAQIEACDKPIVSAIHGTALGGGLEVALGSHYRVALASAKLGVPEVKLGILPGAGGTQRLPRVAGVDMALTMATLGAPVSASKALEAGLVDRIVEGDLLQGAMDFATEIANKRPIPRSCERDEKLAEARKTPNLFDDFRKANARKFKGFEAPELNIQAIEAAVDRPFDEGIQEEQRLIKVLMSGTQARAQQYFFFAERQAAKIDDVPKTTQPRDITTVGVIGAGTMGGGIAMNFLSIGLPVTIVETNQEALDRGVAIVHKNYQSAVAKGRMTADQLEAAMGLLTPTLSYDDLSDCDLIIEAVFERMDIKEQVFNKLDAIAKPGAILASNTSFLDIDDIASFTSRPADVVGMHFFSPANIMKLLEVVRGAKTAPDVLLTVMKIAKKIKKVAAVSGVCWGFIGNRILAQRQQQAENMLLAGATPEQLDKVHVDFGMPMGPCAMDDLAGIDIGWHRDPSRVESIREKLCSLGRFGQKAQAGFYDYDDKRRATPSPIALAAIREFAQQQGFHETLDFSDQDIVERTLYVMVNEGAKILEEGIAQRASDIDVIYVYGYGWPVYRGGPMCWADIEGLDKIVEGLQRQKANLGDDFELSQLLLDKAAKGEFFTR